MPDPRERCVSLTDDWERDWCWVIGMEVEP